VSWLKCSDVIRHELWPSGTVHTKRQRFACRSEATLLNVWRRSMAPMDSIVTETTNGNLNTDFL